MSLKRIDREYDGDWWYKDEEIWFKFEREDLLDKINELYSFISELGTENDALKKEIGLLKTLVQEIKQEE